MLANSMKSRIIKGAFTGKFVSIQPANFQPWMLSTAGVKCARPKAKSFFHDKPNLSHRRGFLVRIWPTRLSKFAERRGVRILFVLIMFSVDHMNI